MFFGYLLVIIGVVWLLKNLGIFTAATWDIIFPSVIIACGLAVILRKKDNKNNSVNID